MTWITSLLRRLNLVPTRNRTVRRTDYRRLQLSPLEERVTPATLTWTGGGGTDHRWMTAANWGGTAPQAGDDLVFGGGLFAYNDYTPGTSFHSITVHGGSTSLTGNAVVLTGSLTDDSNSGAAFFQLPVTTSHIAAVPGSQFAFYNPISGNNLLIDGGGVVYFYSSTGNTYTGTTTLSGNTTLYLGYNTSATQLPGDAIVNQSTLLVNHVGAIASTANVAVNGGNFDLVGFDTTLASLTLSGATADLGSATLGLTSGLSSQSTGTGLGSTITNGTLSILTPSLGNFTATVAHDPMANVDLQIDATVSVANYQANFFKDGAGTLGLSATNSFNTGSNEVVAGTILVTADHALDGANYFQIDDGATVDFDGSHIQCGAQFNCLNVTTRSIGVRSGTTDLTGLVYVSANGAGVGAASGARLHLLHVTNAGSNGLVVANAPGGVTDLQGNNSTFEPGAVTVQSGTLQLSNSGALGDSSISTTLTVADGASLSLFGGVSLPATKSIVLTGNPVSGQPKLASSGGDNFVAGSVMVASDPTISVEASRNLEIDGVVSGNGGFELSGGGTVTLSGTAGNTFTGVATVHGNTTLLLNKSAAVAVSDNLNVGDGTGNATVRLLADNQIADSATVTVVRSQFDLNGHADEFGSLVLTGGAATLGTGGTLKLDTSLTTTSGSGATPTLSGGSLLLHPGSYNSFTFAIGDDFRLDVPFTVVDSLGNFIKSGTGTLTLAAANSLPGAIFHVGAGTARIENAGAFGNAAIVDAVGTIEFTGQDYTFGGQFNLYNATSSLKVLDHTVHLTGTVVAAVDNATIAAANGTTLTIDSLADASSQNYGLYINSGSIGRVLLTGNNGNFRGGIYDYQGYLRLTNSGALGDPAQAATVTVSDDGSLELSGGLTLPASKTLALGDSNADGGAIGKLIVLDGNNVVNGSVSLFDTDFPVDVPSGASLTMNGAIGQQSGVLGLAKYGAGTLTLSGTDTYTGATTVSNGTLLVNGDISASSGVTVQTGATLGGSGTVPATEVMSGGFLSPGNSPGVIHTGNLSLDSGSTYVVQLNGSTVGTQYDQTAVTGTVNLTGSTLSLSLGYAPSVGTVFTVVSNDGTDPVVGTFVGLSEKSTIVVGSTVLQISYIGGDGNDVTLTVLDPMTLTPSMSPTSPVAGEPVTYSVTATGYLGTPTGMVSLLIDGQVVQTVSLMAGTASFDPISSLGVGDHTVSIEYGGDLNYGERTTPLTGGVTIGSAATGVGVTSSEAEQTFGQPVTFTATVSVVSPGMGTPTGTVEFFDGSTSLGTATLMDGTATLTVSSLSVGSHTVTASYLGSMDQMFSSSSGSAMETIRSSVPREVIVSSATNFSHIRVLDSNGNDVSNFFAYPGYGGGVVSAGGDVSGNGTTDIVTGTATSDSHVKVFDGTTGDVMYSFYAFPGFQGGVDVATGDVNGDGFADIVVSTRTHDSHVEVFSGKDGSLLLSFYAFAGYQGGVHVAVGDIDGDGHADIIVSAASNSSHVEVFSGADGSLMRSFYAFDGYQGGTIVTAADFDGSGKAQIVVAAATDSSHVKIFGDGGVLLHSFYAIPDYTGQVSVSVADVNRDGTPDLIVGQSTGAAKVKAFDGRTLDELSSFDAFAGFLGGVSV